MFNKFFKNLSHFLLMILAAGQIFRPIGLLASEVPGLPVIPSIPDAQLGADVRLTECREKFLAFTTSTKTEDIMAYLNSGCRDFSLIGPDGLPLGNGIDMMGAGSNRFPGVNLPPEFSSPVPSIPSYAPNIGAAAVAVPGFETRFTFTDQEKDAESGLLYYGARYYNPTLGRFTQPDPMLLDTKSPEFQQAMLNPQILNPYSYVSNNPLKYVDPTGESEVLFLALLGGIAILAMNAPAIQNALPMFPAMLENSGLTLETLARSAPGSGDAIDIIESFTGRNFLTGEELSSWDKALTRLSVALPSVSSQMLRSLSKIDAGQRLIQLLNQYRIAKLLKQVDEHGLAGLGRAGSNPGIREVVGTSDDAMALFDYLRGENPYKVDSSGALVVPSKTGQGNVTYRQTSKSGPATVDVYGIEQGVDKIKFVPK
ncbi:MAG: hypothetical protein A2445_00325 [Candidatus Jacksonbacteria bacterium RIFOXYC2_FULL_44_29]|nr:MAG: hypothetical protein UW45_C0057G0006 [Parcubacteria group bacterium GW2011_GWC2_44_22]OGY76411.1 MAG: hypothetical protein A2295_06210 [Candidatus Jacksonbacteria bacterium RIFOXYB2_FULL_44_15]OGY78023.1 MAG: hypothetical protein A2550_01850 [Candidatus Jacksonbacteria bacterium RIFOXYD2_FULL_43_21]OGY79701.1 MAG: hypothetical protein A2445_00325 [Candidatus Jacksonbacteria bacterium RIFOXYC2_FULL_44_29]HBH46804.1 hypothetical protein [Candidatus Jacksonbacteria bacterium]